MRGHKMVLIQGNKDCGNSQRDLRDTSVRAHNPKGVDQSETTFVSVGTTPSAITHACSALLFSFTQPTYLQSRLFFLQSLTGLVQLLLFLWSRKFGVSSRFRHTYQGPDLVLTVKQNITCLVESPFATALSQH